MDNQQQQSNYYENRLAKLGITEELNKIELIFGTDEKGKQEIDEATGKFKIYRRPVPIFRKHPEGIEIIVYNLDREQVLYQKESGRKDGTKLRASWSIIRLEKPYIKDDGSEMKYRLPKNQGSYPFFPPSVVDKYEKRQPIDVLFLTEGYFKAFKGAMHGVDIVGLVSITHLKDKVTGALHTDIKDLIVKCKVKRVVFLTDGDCLDLSKKFFEKNDEAKKVDLYKRPNMFYSSISMFKQLLQ